MTDRPRSAFDKLVAEAVAHHKAGRLEEAEAAYHAALGIAPGHPAIVHNLGVLAAERGRHSEAVGHFDAAIAADPRYASAHYNRAVALLALGRRRAAQEGFSRACAIEPDHYASHRALGFLSLALGERGRALDHFARTYELRRGEDRTGIASRSLTHATRSKLLHDAEQFRYLAARRRDPEGFAMRARAYQQVAHELPPEAVELSPAQLDLLGQDYNTAIHVSSAPELAGGALAERPDRAALVRQFTQARTGAVHFDELLKPQALVWLRRYLLESTVWHDFSHIGGFVASYLEDGLACPLLLQIADEVRQTFPELLGEHPLIQAWAFKALEPSAAVDAHADDAAISVNFWVTPSAANLRPGHGGLAICRAPPPAGWEVSGYEADRTRIVSFLEQNAGNALTVSYRENRAVLFQAGLFHWSDSPDFAEGYENHRINITMLFGHRART